MATALWYGPAIEGQWGVTAARRVDWVTDAATVTLHTNTYVPDQDLHDFFNDATNELPTAGNYTAGGLVLGTKSVVYTTATNIVSLRAANSTWTNLTATFRYAVIWVNTAGASTTDPLLGYVDLGAQTIAGVDFTIAWNATEGVLKGTVA